MATAEAKPNIQLEIPFGTEKSFLAPLPVQKMPMIGKKTAQTLKGLGIRMMRTLAEMPVEMLENVFNIKKIVSILLNWKILQHFVTVNTVEMQYFFQ